MSTKPKKLKPEIDAMKKSEVIAHIEGGAIDTAAGAIAGATVGAIGGPIGLAAGAVIGAAVGALAGVELEREDRKAAQHDRELDAIPSAKDKATPKKP